MSGASIYILRCADNSYYTGITKRPLEERLSEHVNGAFHGCYTFTRRLVVLVYSEHHERIAEAVATERRLKGWSRAKKEAYMRGDFDRLTQLAKRRGGKS
jgi:putative endonuclease